MVSGLMNWKQRRTEFFSGTWNILPRISISTRRSKGRKGSPIFSVCLESTPRLLCAAGLKERFLPRTCRTNHRAQRQARTYCRTEQPRYGSQIANQQRVGAGSWRPEVQGEGGELEIRCCIPTDPMRCES